MIDLNLYRFRVGVFNNCKNSNGSKSVSITGNFGTDTRFLNISKLIFYLFLYLYYALCVLGMVIGMITECKLISLSLDYIKFLILISAITVLPMSGSSQQYYFAFLPVETLDSIVSLVSSLAFSAN